MIDHPLVLESNKVLLRPLEPADFDMLVSAGNDERIWPFMPVQGHQPGVLVQALEEAMVLRGQQKQYPFTVVDKLTGNIIGSTRYLDISMDHQTLEIGWTWYQPAYWGTGYNEECKLLLLAHCFENLHINRVQIKTWDQNMRSRKAIEKIGGTFEGILRNFVIRSGGTRNIAMYSIIPEEWPKAKERLTQLLAL